MYKNIVVPVDVFDAGTADKALSCEIPRPTFCWANSSYPCYSGLFSCINPRIYL